MDADGADVKLVKRHFVLDLGTSPPWIGNWSGEK
jgi:hypothetical protein